MTEIISHSTAIIDFQRARRKAEMQNLLALLTGHSTELLSYEEVRKRLRAIEGNRRELQDIPIQSIVGSVGRYTDFNRNFLPTNENAQDRWSNIMVEATGSFGLPPIEVYQIGEVYFVLDGNHRTSVAKELGATHIQAYVTEVRTKIPITPDIQPDDLIIKAEHIDFLEKTNLNSLRPDSDLTLTVPGRYPILLEHIAVHQYFMGIDEKRDVSYEESVIDWYDNVYMPVVEIIKERYILQHFPDRTETDIYLWLAQHQEDLKNELGWQLDTSVVADDLISQYASGLTQTVSKVTNRLLDAVIPDGLESGPPIGQWREEQHAQSDTSVLFKNILVAISSDDHDWDALGQAIQIAQRENASLRGLHVVPGNEQLDHAETEKIVNEFNQRCNQANLTGDIAVEAGTAARKICERAQLADLVIGKLTHPPVDQLLGRLSSGFRIMVRRCSRPILAVPGSAPLLNKTLLAYNGSPKSDEALYIAAYISSQWQLPLSVLTVQTSVVDAKTIQKKAKQYLENLNIQAEYVIKKKDVVENILSTAEDHDCNLILIGGYRANPVVEIVRGSLVDDILRKTTIPILICR